MCKIALFGIFLTLVLHVGTTEGSICEDIRNDIENRTAAYSLLCSKYDPYLIGCCNAIKKELNWNQNSYGRDCQAKSCADLYKSAGVTQDGVYTINPDGFGSFPVRCDMKTGGGGWTVFQRRQDGSENFFRNWSDYKAGFGDPNGEFWLGLDKIHRLSSSGHDVLRVDLTDFNGVQRYAQYEKFRVSDRSDMYRINVGSYSGDAGNSLGYHNNMQFSTVDNDKDKSSGNCAIYWKAGWWYKSCAHANLNGLYLGAGKAHYSGNHWRDWKMNSLKKVEMKTRPSQF